MVQRVILTAILALLCACFCGCCEEEATMAKDWQDKFLKEVNQHYTTMTVLKAEIDGLKEELAQYERRVEEQAKRISELEK